MFLYDDQEMKTIANRFRGETKRSNELTYTAFHWYEQRRDLPCWVDDLWYRNIIYTRTYSFNRIFEQLTFFFFVHILFIRFVQRTVILFWTIVHQEIFGIICFEINISQMNNQRFAIQYRLIENSFLVMIESSDLSVGIFSISMMVLHLVYLMKV